MTQPDLLRLGNRRSMRSILGALLLCLLAAEAGAQRAPYPADSLLFALPGQPHAVVDRALRAAGFRTADDPEVYARSGGGLSESIHISYDRRRVYSLTHSLTCEERMVCERQFQQRREMLRRRLDAHPDEREQTMLLWYNVRGWSYLLNAAATEEALLVTSVSPGF